MPREDEVEEADMDDDGVVSSLLVERDTFWLYMLTIEDGDGEEEAPARSDEDVGREEEKEKEEGV